MKDSLINENVSVEKSGNNFKITFNHSYRKYRLKTNGEVKYFEEIPTTDIYAKLESDGTLKLRASKLDGYEKQSKWNSAEILKIIIEEPIAPKTCSEMFNCTNLTSIENMEYLHTENATSMYYMFYNCNKLETLDLSNLDTSKVTTMRAMFGQCHTLKTLDLSNFNTQNVNSLLNMFYGCNNLINIDLSGFDTRKVTNISWMFRECRNLNSVNLKNLDTSNVISMDYVFGSCTKLKNLDVSGFNTSKVKSMSMMFNGCSNLINLDLSNFDMSNVTDMNAMFRYCSKLSNTSLNSILKMCSKASLVSDKTLKYTDLPKVTALTCNTLSNYQNFTNSGCTIGY